MAQLKKSDLIKILVEEYGYDKEDLKFDAEGKPYTNAKLQALIKAEEEDAKQVEVESKRLAVQPKSVLKENDLVYVMNGLSDTLVYHSQRTNRKFEFSRFGEQDTMDYAELKAMRNRYPRYFTEGWLIVLDKQVQEEFKLTEMYENILTPDNIEKVFEMPVEEMSKFIDALPEGQKLSFVNKAQELFEKEELMNFKAIKMIENKFNFRFEDNAPLDDVIDTREKVGSANIIVVEKR
jgi:hypothetical protein